MISSRQTTVYAIEPAQTLDHISADNIVLNLTYYSYWNETMTPLESGDHLVGDHIILNATFTPQSIVNITRIEVNATAIPSAIFVEANDTTVEIDTRRLGNNATCTVNVTAWLFNGTVISHNISDVFIGNFFEPQIELITPNGGEVLTDPWNVTWTAYDNNTDETLEFEVLVSADGGVTFQLLSAGITESWYVWDSAGFLNQSTYVIEVRVTDGIYTTWDRSDEPFTAGSILPTTTTTPPPSTTATAPTTATNPPPAAADFTLVSYVGASLIGSAFLALAVYYVAKTKM
jgi:hypothetical protein